MTSVPALPVRQRFGPAGWKSPVRVAAADSGFQREARREFFPALALAAVINQVRPLLPEVQVVSIPPGNVRSQASKRRETFDKHPLGLMASPILVALDAAQLARIAVAETDSIRNWRALHNTKQLVC